MKKCSKCGHDLRIVRPDEDATIMCVSVATSVLLALSLGFNIWQVLLSAVIGLVAGALVAVHIENDRTRRLTKDAED